MENLIIKLTEIDVDEYWRTRPNDPEDISRISELIGLGDYPEAMIVCRVGTRYLLLDGFDRYEAWKRAFNGFVGEVSVLIADCPDEKSKISVAIESNIKNPRNYTIGQIGALYTRLRKEFGFSKSEAEKKLRLTREHAEKFEIIRMEATNAVRDESPNETERASVQETTMQEECATQPETTIPEERVDAVEIPIELDRAVDHEAPESRKRASEPESTVLQERIDYNAIRFHVERLPKLVPPAWTDVRQTLETLTDQVIKHMQEENQK